MQVAAGNIDRDAGGRGYSQEVTALKFKAVETQASFLSVGYRCKSWYTVFVRTCTNSSYALTLLLDSTIIAVWAALHFARVALRLANALVYHTFKDMCVHTQMCIHIQ